MKKPLNKRQPEIELDSKKPFYATLGMAAAVSILSHAAAIEPARDSVVKTAGDTAIMIHDLVIETLHGQNMEESEHIKNKMGNDGLGKYKKSNDKNQSTPQTATAENFIEKEQIFDPLNEKEKQKIRQEVTNRLNRIDINALNGYRRNAFLRLTEKKFIGVNELYPDLERLYGVPDDAVDQFWKKIQERINNIKSRIQGSDFSDDFIREVVEKRYEEGIYAWGQGSCVDFENSGFYNCVSMAMEMHIIFETLLRNLPKNVQKHWRLGSIFEGQHEIAVLWKIDENTGKYLQTYLLQAPMKILEGDGNEPGTAIITLDDLKLAIVSDNITVIQAKPGKFQKGARIIIESNQPVPRNIHIEGELRGASFNLTEIQRKKIQPQQIEKSVFQGMEVMPVDTGSVEMRNRFLKTLYMTNLEDPAHDGYIMARDLIMPSVETIQAIEAKNDQENDKIYGVELGDVSLWSPEAIQALFVSQKMRKGLWYYISLATKADGSFSSQFLKTLSAIQLQKKDIGAIRLRIRRAGKAEVSSRSLSELLQSGIHSFVNSVLLHYMKISKEDASVMVNSEVHIVLEGEPEIDREVLEIFLNSKNYISVHSAFYQKLLDQFPELDDRILSSKLVPPMSLEAFDDYTKLYGRAFEQNKWNRVRYDKLKFLLGLYQKSLSGKKVTNLFFNMAVMLSFYNRNKDIHPRNPDFTTPESKEFMDDVTRYVLENHASYTVDDVVKGIKDWAEGPENRN